jgi:hypothetical protein
MWKVRMCIVGTVGALALVPGAAALASSGGDSNAGDVWVDNAGAPPGPGHEMDPHLACGPINLYGSGLADSGGTFGIDSWPPSGQQQQVYGPAQWSYNTTTEGTQTIATFSGSQLVQDAVNAGATASNQGYHFKLDFSQDPQKHKTFWINCPPPPSGKTSAPQQTSQPTETSETEASENESAQTESTETESSSPVVAGSPTTTASVKGVHTNRRRHHTRRHRRLVRPKRHTAPKQRSVSAASTAAPAFTG